MKIEISAPASQYSTCVDTGVMDVTLFKVFNGVTLITEHGERLSVCMRDSGFELVYSTPTAKFDVRLNDDRVGVDRTK